MEQTDKACYLNDSSFKSTKPKMDNTELVVNVESNGTKGQLNSEWIFEIIVSPKRQTWNYIPNKQGS